MLCDIAVVPDTLVLCDTDVVPDTLVLWVTVVVGELLEIEDVVADILVLVL